MITPLTIDDAAQQVKTFQLSMRQLKKPYQEIGEYLKFVTDDRFDREVAPDGTKWAQNADSTILAYMRKRTGGQALSQRKTATGGRTLTKKGMRALVIKKILRDTGTLQDTMMYQATDDYLIFGSSPQTKAYAAAMQYGVPAKNIPDRPFIGLTDADKTFITDTLSKYLVTSWTATIT